MNLIASAPSWLAVIFLLLLLVAALEDSWRMRIGNWVSAALVGGAIVAAARNGPSIDLWQNLALFAAVLAVGTIMFARSWMGGGDIKLLAASSLWFDLSSGWRLLVAIAIAGGLETFILFGLRRLPWPPIVPQRLLLLRRREGIPYGIAIAVGAALMTWWMRK